MQVFEAADKQAYDGFLKERGGSVLQSWTWGEFQKKMGRRVWRLLVSSDVGKILAAATVIRMPLARGLSYFYCPKGPQLKTGINSEKVWDLLLDKLSDLQVSEKPVFFRIDPEISGRDAADFLSGRGFKKIPWEVQPKDTLILDLISTEAQLLHQAKPKTRYNIQLARKKGVHVEACHDGQKVKIFWDLIRATAARDRFSAHPYLYYFNLMEVLGKAGLATLFLATYQRRPLAAAITSHFAGRAVYLHGASSDRMRSVMAPHLIQWSAMLGAKANGALSYDFGGIAPEGARRSHPLAGVSRFKRGFGGRAISYIGAHDLVYEKWWYRIYRLVRRLKRFGA